MFGDWKIILQSSKQKQIGIVKSLLDQRSSNNMQRKKNNVSSTGEVQLPEIEFSGTSNGFEARWTRQEWRKAH